MAGIISFGAYVPITRLSRATIGKHWGTRPGKGEKAVANYDEDSLTMAVEAARLCLGKANVKDVDAFYLATTSAPYAEKQGAALAAAVLSMAPQTHTMDFGNSLRCGTSAIAAALNAVNSGAAKQVLVCVTDVRSFKPKSAMEMNGGDGAVAFLIGKENVVAEIKSFDTFYDEIQDVWRPANERFLRSAEDRFVQDFGYSRVLKMALTGTMEKYGLKAEDIKALCPNFSNAKTFGRLFKKFGFTGEGQVEASLLMDVGETGSPMALMNAVVALENAAPGDKILVANYGNGCDVLVIEATPALASYKPTATTKEQIDNKIMLDSYSKYLIWRELIDVDTVSRPSITERQPSPSAQWREVKGELALTGTICNECNTPMYPPQRVCMNCKSLDKVSPYTFTDKQAKVFSFSHDYMMETLDSPVTSTVVDFEGGGRMVCDMTDRRPEDIVVGMELKMTFRKLYYVGGIYNYWWKCKPVSTSKQG